MNIFLDEQSYTTCNKFPMIPADSDEIIHQEYLNHDIPWLSSSNYFKKILIQTRQPGNHPGPFCHPNLQQQHAGEVDEFQGLGPGGSTIHFKRAPKRWFLGKLSGEKKNDILKTGFPWENDLYVFFSQMNVLRSSLLWADHAWIRSSLYLNPWW